MLCLGQQPNKCYHEIMSHKSAEQEEMPLVSQELYTSCFSQCSHTHFEGSTEQKPFKQVWNGYSKTRTKPFSSSNKITHVFVHKFYFLYNLNISLQVIWTYIVFVLNFVNICTIHSQQVLQSRRQILKANIGFLSNPFCLFLCLCLHFRKYIMLKLKKQLICMLVCVCSHGVKIAKVANAKFAVMIWDMYIIYD